MADVKKSTVRLSEADLENIRKIIATGAASSESEAIRVALSEAAQLVRRLSTLEREVTTIRKQLQDAADWTEKTRNDPAVMDVVVAPSARRPRR